MANNYAPASASPYRPAIMPNLGLGASGANPYAQVQPMGQASRPPEQMYPTQPPQPGTGGSTVGMSNPYLAAQSQAIQQQADQNLQNTVLPGINSGAMMAGGYGGSRQGIAQGNAIGMAQQGVSNALASMYGDAYKNDQNLANQWQIAGLQSDTAKATANIGANASMYGSDKSAAASMYGADKSSAASMYGADKSSAATLGAAGMSAAASRYASDNSLSAAQMNNATSRYGMDQSYNLGLGNLANTQQQTANQLALGQGNLNLGFAGLGNQFNIANLNNQTQRYGMDQSYNLGLGNLGLGYQNSANSYDLGLRSNDLGYANLDANINQNNFNNQMSGANFGLNVYNTLQNGNQAGITAGNNLQNTALNYFNQFSNNANAIGNGYSTTATGTSTNPLMDMVSGAQTGNRLYNSLGGSSSVTDGGYSVGQGNSYGGTVDVNGNFVPYRSGM
jgi:hypothetical protein